MQLFDHYLSGENLYTRIVTPVCEAHGLTYMEFTIVMFLANNPQYDTASELVRVRHLTKSHVSVSVRSLQEKGLVQGTYEGRDRRTIHLHLTERASDAVRDGRQAQRRFQEILFTGFTREEMEQAAAFTGRIHQNIQNYEK